MLNQNALREGISFIFIIWRKKHQLSIFFKGECKISALMFFELSPTNLSNLRTPLH